MATTTNTPIYYTPEQLAELAQRYVPSAFRRGMTNLRGDLISRDGAVSKLRRAHDLFAGSVRLSYDAFNDLRKSGLDPSVIDAAINLVVDEAVDFVHDAIAVVEQWANQAKDDLKKQRPQESESTYQAYAGYRWGLMERALEKMSLPELLQTITDRKDVRLLRENYPLWYQAKNGKPMSQSELEQVGKWLDTAEETFMTPQEKKTFTTWNEIAVGLARMHMAYQQALGAIERLRSLPRDVEFMPRVVIPLWADRGSQRVIWVE